MANINCDMNDPEVQESLHYLMVSKDEKIKTQAQPFDGKKNCWIPEPKEGYISADIQSIKADNITVKTSKGDVITVKKDDVSQMNPPKYEKCEDMANLTYLNDATVLHNLRSRYSSWLIYTYSGLFCVAINPYKRLPIYTMKMVAFYRGKKKNEVPPHLYFIADNAYASMVKDRENQSLLITGESGAGKTENTKKVIQYFAFVASSSTKKDEAAETQSLEDQIVSANPVLEAYGNAKTTRNNNSSRFGKFIRIHFSSSGKIAGADIESYLLEKSRVTFQQPAERNYHIFYQLLSPALTDYHKELLVEQDASKYHFIAQGQLTVDNIDDDEEMKLTDEAFNILNFTAEEKLNLFKCTGAILHFGNSKWKQRAREDQAETDGTEECEKVSHLLGIESADLLKGLLKPRIKVGNEWVNKGQNKEQVYNAIGALSKSIYSRCFRWLVDRVNETLDAKTKRQYFIGVLDIAGFEIFDYNGFEQLCINYTNEKLQQFFNHHMFVLEQEEYKKEGIFWEMMNFGMDLQACIDLIEKPMGIFSILEEECIVPKGSDKTFQEKLYNNHLGKHPNFGKPKPQKGKLEAHFDMHHYAGTVSYSVTGWLEKNKDPINTTVATLFKSSKTNNLIAFLYQDMGNDDDKKAGKAKRGGGLQTISSGHREQLTKLMNTLKVTSPHFVRCIIPNEIKTGGVLDPHLVMHQLHCNGVLEGIRICRKGFPNRMIYAEFKQRYSILAPNAVPKGFCDAIKATSSILKDINLNEEQYRTGTTKIFFKAGVLGQLEDMRDIAVSRIISMLQANIRLYSQRKRYRLMIEEIVAKSILQRNIKKYLSLRNWPWWKLYTKVKPLLSVARQEEEIKAREEEFEKLKVAYEKEEKMRRETEDNSLRLVKEKNDLYTELQAERDSLNVVEQRMEKLIVQKSDLESQLLELEEKLNDEESQMTELVYKKKKLEADCLGFKKENEEIVGLLKKSESDNKTKDTHITNLQEELVKETEAVSKLNKEKKRLEEESVKTNQMLQLEGDKVIHLNKLKIKLEQTLEEYEDQLEREKKQRVEIDKAKKRFELDFKASQAHCEELEVMKLQMEDLLSKKEMEISQLALKNEESQTQTVNMQRRMKEMHNKYEELEEELETERQAKIRADRQRAELSRELDELSDKLEQTGGMTNVQCDLNKKRESELVKLRKELEEANVRHETTVVQLRKKHQEAVVEMGEQIDHLQKTKTKLEKEKHNLKEEIQEKNTQNEYSNKAKSLAEKNGKHIETQLQSLNLKIEELNRTVSELNLQKQRMTSDNTELGRQLTEKEKSIENFAKIRLQLQAQIDEARQLVEDESRVKSSLLQQLRNTTADLDIAKDQATEEHDLRTELQKQLIKSNNDLAHWRSKYEHEGMARAEELEEAKRKLAQKLNEAEDQVDQALSKCASLEKIKQRLQAEVEDLVIDVERANASATSMEKKQKQFDKLITEWKIKCEDITMELEISQKESRLYSTELFKLKSQYDESIEQADALRRENKNLADEIKDLIEQLSEGGKNSHEMEKNCKRLEMEKDELQVALEEAESQLEQEEAKCMRMQLEMSQVRQEIDRRVREKEEEFDLTRLNHQRALESIQASLEAETKSKTDAIKQKKKLEADINELEVSLDHANRTNADSLKSIKKLSLEMDEMASQLEDEQRQKEEAQDAILELERRNGILVGESEELRGQLESCDKVRKAYEVDLHDAAERISELLATCANIGTTKRKLEVENATLQADLEESVVELKTSEERMRKSTDDANRLSEELRHEQEHSLSVDKLRKNLDQQVRDLQIRLDEAEANALKGGKRLIQKLEQRILELEQNLDLEQRNNNESLKEIRKYERRLKELLFQADEDRKNQYRVEDMVEKLQNKLKIYKKQIEDAEEIANANIGKIRKAQLDLEAAESRAIQAEAQLSRARSGHDKRLNKFISSSEKRDVFQRSASVVETRASSVKR